MLSRGRVSFIVLSLTTVLLVVGGSLRAAGTRAEDDGTDSLYKYLAVFTEVLGLVDRAYVDKTDVDRLMAGAFEGAVDALDPFSLYVPADQVDAFLTASEVGSGRSGLIVLKERGVAYAASVVEGSPAAAAGLERGDVLSRLQGRSTHEMPLWEIRAVLAGPVGTEITLERLRLGQQEDVAFKLADFEPPGVVLETHRGVAVLRLNGFYADTPINVETSLRTVAGAGAGLPELEVTDKLVIDLRGVAGGEEKTAYRVAELFARGELGSLASRGETLEVFEGQREPLWKGRVAVLIDQGTQGPAEVLASVLQQRGDAVLVGSESFGHSGRLSLVELSNGGRLQITDAYFTGPDREPIDSGLTPDFEVRPVLGSDDDEEPFDDPVLDRGLEVLLENEEAPAERRAA